MRRFKYCTVMQGHSDSPGQERWFVLFSDLVDKPNLTQHEVRGEYPSEGESMTSANKWTQPKRGTIWLRSGTVLKPIWTKIK